MRHGTNGFTSLPQGGVLRIFSPLKIRRLRPGLNPRTWVPKASTLPLDHRNRLHNKLVPFTSSHSYLRKQTYSVSADYITSIDGLLLHSQRRKIFLTSHLKVLFVDGEKSEVRSSFNAKHEKFSQAPTGCSGQRCRCRRKKYHYIFYHTVLFCVYWWLMFTFETQWIPSKVTKLHDCSMP